MPSIFGTIAIGASGLLLGTIWTPGAIPAMRVRVTIPMRSMLEDMGNGSRSVISRALRRLAMLSVITMGIMPGSTSGITFVPNSISAADTTITVTIRGKSILSEPNTRYLKRPRLQFPRDITYLRILTTPRQADSPWD